MKSHRSTLENKRAELQQLSHLLMGLEALALLLTWHFYNSIRWSQQSSILLHAVSALKLIRGGVDVGGMALVLEVRRLPASLQPHAL